MTGSCQSSARASALGLVLLGAAGVLSGCMHESYGRREVGAAEAPQPRSVSYALPAEAPKGQVYVVSLGRVAFQDGGGGPAPYLHMRLAAQNDSDQAPWQLDPNDQVVRFDGGAPVAAAYAKASTQGPVLSLAAGQRGHLDLYYPLPGIGGVPQIGFEWRLQRGEERVANTTTFERARDPQQSYAYYEPVYTPRVGVHLRMGPAWWWHDPFWSYYDAPWGWGPYYYHPYHRWNYWDRPYYRPAPRRSYPRSSGGDWRAPPVGPSSPAPAAPAPAAPRSGDSDKSRWRGGGR